MTRAQRIIGAILSGLCLAAAQAPWSLWPLLPVGVIAALYIASKADTPKRAAWTGWVIGTSYFAASMLWIVEPFFVDAARHAWMAPFALIFMSGGLALFWAAAFWGAARLKTPWSIIALWPLAEFARGTVFTGFPWGLLAYGWIDTPIAQSAAWIGPYGLSALTVGLCALPVLWRWKTGAALCVVAFASVAALGHWDRNRAPEPLGDAPVVRLNQPNAPQHEKWHPDFMPVFYKRQIGFTKAGPTPDAVIWPETSVPSWLNDADRILADMSQAAGDAALVFGIQRYEDRDVYNTAAVLSKDGEVLQVYDKHHLVPFGEYLPLQSWFSAIGLGALADTTGGGFTAGPGPYLIDIPGVGVALPLICYEAVFPQYANAGEARPDFLLHLTNDAWFGTFSGPQQHVVQARFRAIEQGLPLLRSANTGISAAIDAKGDVVESISLGQTGFIDVSIPAPRTATFYSKYKNTPFLILAMLLLFVTVYRHTPRKD